ncbi:hypothetical protein FPSE_03246 [Fusarium pseudograminearum CS3096]|uniref:Actin-like ATPase domain-containing protein n=1 Tax=Fusarium pseudograminearum (strain CS3096) TaxID=1028729 RepID=K3W1V9_FUSPC|nr:hypothetical protein FPSE_03246 [Fusarium pseudograminearum CS3096]EKJ76580.1 hypothetical protein FPSE_03246 [Fusarium pseudograminearum CS3096]
MSSQPDLRIGVDFGATFTGVSWATPKEEDKRTKIVTRWPGQTEEHSKVPTVLSKHGSGTNIKWGFLCKDIADDQTWKLFKLLLEPATYQKESSREVRGPWIPETIDEVYGVVVAYLGQIYIRISNIIPELIKQNHHFSVTLRNKTWDSMKVEFVFSTPAQWEAPVSQCFRHLIFRSGFGKIKNHSAVLGLTEAEAIVYHTCNAQKTTGHQVQNDNIILSIDAGDVTTDLAFVKKFNDSVTLEEISPVTGIGVGSIRIDGRFADLIEERMERYPTVCSHLPVDFPVKASQSNGFQDWKHIFGRELCEDLDVCSTTVAGGNGYTHKKFRIHDGELFFTRAELKGCLDETLERIKKHIQYALQLWKNRKNQLVDYIVLSGGLGGSDYVFEELVAYINSLAAKRDSRLVGVQFLRTAGDTRTAVVSGLLGWRNDNAQALREYIARASYGIVVRNPPPSLLSASDFITQDGRVKWIVKYGSYIKYFQPITVKLTKYFNKNDPWTWTEEVMWLDKEERILPPRKIHEKRGGEVLYRVDLGVVEGSTKLETVTSFMDSMVYLKCDFELALMIGPSGDCVVTVSKNTLKLTEREP